MTKMILTLVALAALGTAALAPTDASAFRHPAAKRAGGVHHAGRPAARPAHVRNFNIRIRLGARPAWHRGAVHGPVRFGYRPVWHRPGFVRRVGYAAPAVVVAAPYAGAPASGPAPVQPAMQSQVTGMNVTMVAVPDGQFNMTGQGQWTRQVNNGKTFQFAEVGRDASSVTLNDAARGIQVILDLGQRKVLLAAANGTTRPLFPIVNASAR
jgi:hypothetical protein